MKFFNNVATGALTGLASGSFTGYLSGATMESISETPGSWAFRLQAAAAGGIYGFVAGGLAAAMTPDSLSGSQRAAVIGVVSGGVGGGLGAYPLNKAIAAYYTDTNAQYTISPENLILSLNSFVGSILGTIEATLLNKLEESQAQKAELEESQAQKEEESTGPSFS